MESHRHIGPLFHLHLAGPRQSSRAEARHSKQHGRKHHTALSTYKEGRQRVIGSSAQHTTQCHSPKSSWPGLLQSIRRQRGAQCTHTEAFVTNVVENARTFTHAVKRLASVSMVVPHVGAMRDVSYTTIGARAELHTQAGVSAKSL